jgi:2-dehydropantoate 2-reductase
VVAFNVIWRDANHAYQTTDGSLLVQQDPSSDVFAPVFRQAGVPVDLYRDMVAIKWGKLLLNLVNPVNALANVSLRDTFLQRDLRCVMATLIDEGFRVLNAAGIRPAQIAHAPPPKLFAIALRLPNWLFMALARKIMRMDPVARASMCDDLHQGKPTEVDDLCGAIVRLGQHYGIATPANQAMCNLVHQFQPGQQWSGKDLLAALDIKR